MCAVQLLLAHSEAKQLFCNGNIMDNIGQFNYVPNLAPSFYIPSTVTTYIFKLQIYPG